MLKNKKILIIITGSIAAYKALYLIRILKDHGAKVNVVMTQSSKKFITPLSVASICGNKVYDDLFNLTNETEESERQEKSEIKSEAKKVKDK